jgi:hypothetical protein
MTTPPRLRAATPPRLLAAVALCLLLAAGCSDSSTGPEDPMVRAPSNLRAWSDSGAIGLLWDASISEDQANFGSYQLTVRDKTADTAMQIAIPKGTTRATIRRLVNGVRYQFVLWAATSRGKKSADSITVEWAPAVRHETDSAGAPIRVYVNSSSEPCGVDLHDAQGRCELLAETSPAFATRADCFVYAVNLASDPQLLSPHRSLLNPGLQTQFSTAPAVEADSFDDAPATVSPASATYVLDNLPVTGEIVTKNRIVYGRLLRGNDRYYFRLLLKRSSENRLVHGSGIDRYLLLAVSFQDTRNIPYAKR